MKVYRVMIYDRDEGMTLTWFGNKRVAEKVLRDAQAERDEPAVGPEGVEEVNIPTDKEGLLRWLNANFNRDNG